MNKQKRNHYAEAIDILSNDVDFKSILIEIAKAHPSIFVAAYKSISWEKQLKQGIANGLTKIEAIKLCRALNGMSLQDAKSTVESLKDWG